MPGILTSTSITNARDQQRARVAADELEVQRARDVHPDQPDRAVGDVLEQVGRAVALALRAASAPRRPSRPSPRRPPAGRTWRSAAVGARAAAALSAHRTRHSTRRPPDAFRRLAPSGARCTRRPEVVAALLVGAVLVVGRAAGREQHDVAGPAPRRALRRPRARGRRSRAAARRSARAPRAARPRSRRSGRRRRSAPATGAASGA